MRLVGVVSLLSTRHYGQKDKTGRHGIKVMRPSGAACLLADWFFSVSQNYENLTKRVGLV